MACDVRKETYVSSTLTFLILLEADPFFVEFELSMTDRSALKRLRIAAARILSATGCIVATAGRHLLVRVASMAFRTSMMERTGWMSFEVRGRPRAL